MMKRGLEKIESVIEGLGKAEDGGGGYERGR